jgi:hypothetical protein
VVKEEVGGGANHRSGDDVSGGASHGSGEDIGGGADKRDDQWLNRDRHNYNRHDFDYLVTLCAHDIKQ